MRKIFLAVFVTMAILCSVSFAVAGDQGGTSNGDDGAIGVHSDVSASSATEVQLDNQVGAQVVYAPYSDNDYETYSMIPLSVGMPYAGLGELLLNPDSYGEVKTRIGGVSSLAFLPFGIVKTSAGYNISLQERRRWEASETQVGSEDLVSLHPARLFYVEPDIQVNNLAPTAEVVVLTKAKIAGLNRPGNVFIGYVTVSQRSEVYVSKPRELLVDYSGFVARGYGANVAVLISDLSELATVAASQSRTVGGGLAGSWLDKSPVGATVVVGAARTQGETGTVLRPGAKFALYWVADITPVVDFPEPKEKPLDLRGTELLNCPDPIPANGMKRLRSANAELDKYFSSEVREEKDLALVRARDDLVQATRDGLRGQPLKVAQLGVASVWWEMSLITTGDKKPYTDKAIHWTEKAGEKKFPVLESFKPQLEAVVSR